jgi:hypothetical protein
MTAHLQQICDGQPSCAYRVDVRVVADRAGCGKNYVAEWTCGDDPAVRRAAAAAAAGPSSIVELRCD